MQGRAGVCLDGSAENVDKRVPLTQEPAGRKTPRASGVSLCTVQVSALYSFSRQGRCVFFKSRADLKAQIWRCKRFAFVLLEHLMRTRQSLLQWTLCRGQLGVPNDPHKQMSTKSAESLSRVIVAGGLERPEFAALARADGPHVERLVYRF